MKLRKAEIYVSVLLGFVLLRQSISARASHAASSIVRDRWAASACPAAHDHERRALWTRREQVMSYPAVIGS